MPKAATVAEYLSGLTKERRAAIEALRKVIRKNIDKKFEEGIQYGMVGYYVPHSIYPNGYHCDPKQPLPFASIAAQKNHIGLYLFCVYMNPELQKWFVDAWKKTGKKLDMGKSCVRVKTLEDIPMEVVGELFRRVKAKDFIAHYDELYGQIAAKKPTKKKPTKKKPTKKIAAAKAPATRKAAKKKVSPKKAPAKKKPAARKAAPGKKASKRRAR